MRVAIVGANFLGSATAYYVRQALNANRATAATDSESEPAASTQKKNKDDEDEIVVFEQLPRAGGHKFDVLTLNNVSVAAGTASAVDVSSAPLLQSLLRDTGIASPPATRSFQWSIFDWDAGSYCVSKYRSSFLSWVASNTVFLFFLHALLLASSWTLYPQLAGKGIRAFTYYYRDEDGLRMSALRYGLIMQFAVTVLFCGGFIPLRWLLRLHNWFIYHLFVRIISTITYGSPTISTMYMLTDQFKKHLSLIDKHDSCTSCITLAHLLSACGLAKYAKKSTLEHFGPFQLFPSYLSECVSPSMSSAYGDSMVAANSDSNALATMLNVLTSAPVPVSTRNSPAYLSADETNRLCPALLEAANAKFELNTRIVSVMKNGDKYDLQAVSGTARNDEDETSKISAKDVGTFDAVLVAAVVDPAEFQSDAFECEPDLLFSLGTKYQSHTQQPRLNSCKYVSLIRGDLKSSFFGLGSSKGMLDRTYVLNSVNCSEVERVQDDVWKVSGSEKLKRGSSMFQTMFTDVKNFVATERPTRKYHISPLTKVNGNTVPNVILARKFINVAAVDRVCSDVNIECAAARNAASLLRAGVAEWR